MNKGVNLYRAHIQFLTSYRGIALRNGEVKSDCIVLITEPFFQKQVENGFMDEGLPVQ